VEGVLGMQEKQKLTLSKTLTNPVSSYNQILRDNYPADDNRIETRLPSMPYAKMEPLPAKFSRPVASRSSGRLSKSQNASAANPRGIVQTGAGGTVRGEDTPTNERQGEVTVGRDEIDSYMEQLKLQNRLTAVAEMSPGQPPAKISAVPGESGSSQVFTSPSPIPDPTDKETARRLTILKVRRLAGMTQ
jgi:hypothetical protein